MRTFERIPAVVTTFQFAVDSSTHYRDNFKQVREELFLAPGQVAGLSGIPGSGLTRIGMFLLAPYAAKGVLVYLDVRGWASPLAAWELGIPQDRLVVVRCSDAVAWSRIVATLLDGVSGVYAEVPPGLGDQVLHKLAARAKARRTPLVLRPVTGELPRGVAHLRLETREVLWEGTDAGHGNLTNRRIHLLASGKAMRGMQRMIEVEDDGTNNLRVVPQLVTSAVSPDRGRARAG